MKVSELIKQLKKMPKDAEVYIQDHDHGEYEWNGRLWSVSLINFDNISPWDKSRDGEFELDGKVVMLRVG